MRHQLTLSLSAYKLRPVEYGDAEFICDLRSDKQLNKYINASAVDVESQRNWLSGYYERLGEYYFVVERLSDGRCEGLISLYNLDESTRSAEWGRWILLPGSLAAIESAFLIYSCGFGLLGLKRIYCRTIEENLSVVSFHDSCGIREKHPIEGDVTVNNQSYKLVEHAIDIKDWPEIAENMCKLINRLSAKRKG